jgi:DNA-binding transcriptional LysR family regulator
VDDVDMDLRRLELLVALHRLGSMRLVADELGVTTSTVSQQLARLAHDVGTAVLEPDGRRVRLTPAGRRLAEHAVGILAAVDAARSVIDPLADPVGRVRVASFATAVRRSLLPIVATLRARHPAVTLSIHEHEPAEALELLAADRVDLALVYDYNLAPSPTDPAHRSTPLWDARWSLGVPATAAVRHGDRSPSVLAGFRDEPWIVNSRNVADEHVVRAIASMSGFEPRVTHRADSLELVEDLIAAHLGVALLPADQPPGPGIRLVPLSDPEVVLRARATTRRVGSEWAPLALVVDLLARDRTAPPSRPG